MINSFIDSIKLDTLDKNSFKKLFENKNIIDGSIVADIKGIAMFDKIIIDVDQLSDLNPRIQVFCLLHELCHSLRFDKLGADHYLKMLANENFDEFAYMVIYEELLADRFASFMFYRLTNMTYRWDETQKLSHPYYRNQYVKNMVPLLFKKIKNRKAYEKFWAKFYEEK